MREGVLMNEQLLKMNGLSVKILDMLSFESHLGMGYARFEKKYTSINISNFFGDFRVGKNILKKSEKTDAQKCFTDEERICIWNTSYSAY